ncbi:hypothetical protein T3H97_04480 [Paenibacillus sp. LX16]|uniref:hypothetical protein n=1 Tax=Paenibacillus TaxID=44249 RepID=UPI002E2989DC|nr:hypothetical protein [Paenibacillus sp. LX16]
MSIIAYIRENLKSLTVHIPFFDLICLFSLTIIYMMLKTHKPYIGGGSEGYYCATVEAVTEEMKNYIVNQFTEEKNESFRIENEF